MDDRHAVGYGVTSYTHGQQPCCRLWCDVIHMDDRHAVGYGVTSYTWMTDMLSVMV